jgi:hypothetical protein
MTWEIGVLFCFLFFFIVLLLLLFFVLMNWFLFMWNVIFVSHIVGRR